MGYQTRLHHLLMVIVLLSGCISQQADPSLEKCTAIKGQDKKDWCYINSAISSGNVQICDRIAGQQWKSQCYGSVLKDTSICDNVTDAHWRDACYYNVATGLKDKGICADIRDMNYRIGCFRDSSNPDEGKPACDNSDDINQTLWCYAKETQNPSLCKNIDDTFWRIRCMEDTNISAGTTSNQSYKTTTTTAEKRQATTLAIPQTTNTAATEATTPTLLETTTTEPRPATTETTSTSTLAHPTTTTPLEEAPATTSTTMAVGEIRSCQDYCKNVGAGYSGVGGCLFDSSMPGDCRGLNQGVPRWKPIFKGGDPSYAPYQCPTDTWCCCMETIP